jgi:hypothetical protein
MNIEFENNPLLPKTPKASLAGWQGNGSIFQLTPFRVRDKKAEKSFS